MDPVSAAAMTFGVAILLISWLLLLIVSFKEDFNWGLMSVFMPPLSYLYSALSWDKAKEPVMVGALGMGLIVYSLMR